LVSTCFCSTGFTYAVADTTLTHSLITLFHRFALQLSDEINLNVLCQGRKLAFQFDQTDIGYDELLGREVNVTVANISDRYRNDQIGPAIKFSKTIANLNLEEVSTAFIFTFETESCVFDDTIIQNEIAGILALSDPSRINVVTSECLGDITEAEVTIGPVPSPGVRRTLSEKDTQDAIGLFYLLVGMTDDNGLINRRNLGTTIGTSFSVSDMKIIPGATDVMLYKPSPDLALKEEMIRIGKADENTLLQADHIVRLGESLEHVGQSLEKMSEKMNENMNQLSSEHDGKLEETVHHDEKDGTIHSYDSQMYTILEQIRLEQNELKHAREEMQLEQNELKHAGEEMHGELVLGGAIVVGMLLLVAVTGIVIFVKR